MRHYVDTVVLGACLSIDAVCAVFTPQLREVLQAVPPELATSGIEFLIHILAGLKVFQVLLHSQWHTSFCLQEIRLVSIGS